jgi:zinc protease
VGGFNNATTFDDSTPYYEVVPSNYLETLLWAEAERMGSLKVDEANFKSEREVVKEEFRFRILAPPYGRFFYSLETNSFAVHPYKRPGIGSIEDLDAATIEDVRKFHSTYYRPDNAVLIVAGDFDQKQLDGWVDKYFGPLPNPSTSIPRVTVKEPPRAAPKNADVKVANVPLPAVAITWLAPPASSGDSAALNVAAAVLAKGESSRLYQSLVYKSQVAQQIDAGADLREDLGIFYVLAVISSDHSLKEGQEALNRELKTLQEKLVPASELEKAKNLLLTDALRERETNNGKASSLGQSIVLEKDAAEVNRGLERLQAVTAADVQRVMKKYVAGGKPVIINYSAEQAAVEKKEGGQ